VRGLLPVKRSRTFPSVSGTAKFDKGSEAPAPEEAVSALDEDVSMVNNKIRETRAAEVFSIDPEIIFCPPKIKISPYV